MVRSHTIVWEVCLYTYMCHAVFKSGLRGIIPLRNLLEPSWPASIAICCCEALGLRQPSSYWASTGLLQNNITGFLLLSLLLLLQWVYGKPNISQEQFIGPFMITAKAYKSYFRRFYFVYERVRVSSLSSCLTWLHPCNSREEKQEWRDSSVTHILFLTHNLLQNHTSLCCSHTMRCMRVCLHSHEPGEHEREQRFYALRTFLPFCYDFWGTL